MSYLPPIQSNAKQRRTQVLDFRGYNDSPTIADGEMRDMFNLTSDKYPNLYQRKLRNTYIGGLDKPSAILARRENLAIIDNDKFYYGMETIEGQQRPKFIMALGTLAAGQERKLAAINTRIVIFPDKKWFNTETEASGDMECEITSGTGVTVAFTTSTITFSGGGTPFAGLNADDAISIAGCTGDLAVNNSPLSNGVPVASAIITSIDGAVLTFPENTFTAGTEATGPIVIARTVPDMDFIMESNNRLWGCKGSSIYASKLGDPLNWNYFQGLSGDSYQVDVGTDGSFTGCAPYPSHLLFFKEDYIHKMYGSKPTNYQLVTDQCYSLEDGSHKSIQIINGVVFYKSRMGIMAYSGGTPEHISKCFGNKRYGKSVAGTDGIKYYVSMQYGSTWDLMVFDLEKNLWHKEDHTKTDDWAFINGELVYIDSAESRLVSVNASSFDEDEKIDWMALLGPYDEYLEDRKIYSKIKMRLEMGEDSQVTVSVSYDGFDWIQVSHLYAESRRAVALPIIPRRCDRFSIKLEGRGFCQVASIVREYTNGSDS